MRTLLLVLSVLLGVAISQPTWCGKQKLTEILDNDQHPYDVAYNPSANEYLLVYIERTDTTTRMSNTIYAQRLSETTKVGNPILLTNAQGDKRYVTVRYNKFDNTYLVLYMYQPPPTPDWDVYSIQLGGDDATPLASPKLLKATPYDEQQPTLEVNPNTGKYVATLETWATNGYIWIGSLQSNGDVVAQSENYIGGGSRTDPRNLSRPDIAYNTKDNDFMMALQYDQLDNHDIVALHLFSTGQPDFSNYNDIANFSASDVDANEREPTIAYDSNSNRFMVAFERVKNPDSGWIAELVTRKVDTTSKPNGDYQTLTTAQVDASFSSIRYDNYEMFGLVCESHSRDLRQSDVDFIRVDKTGKQYDRITVQGKHRDDQPVITYSTDDARWMIAWSAHPQSMEKRTERKQNIMSSNPNLSKRSRQERELDPSPIYRLDGDFFGAKDLADLSNVEDSGVSKRITWPGTTSELYVALLCSPETKAPVPASSGMTSSDLKPLLWLFIAGTIGVIMLGIAGFVGWWYLKKRQAAASGLPKPSIKYVSLNTAPEEDDQP